MAKAIMIQGTMSNVGKSLIVAGLCRIFCEDGYRAAPFKSQNMALNSFVTMEGLEMGRAQVMQAEAAGIEADVRMNPILLKPTTEMGSQLIVNGEVRGNFSARDYFGYKKHLIPEILRAYRSLEDEYDIIVLEGAGSPAEINLNQDDIVNMGMARMAGAPVVLAGDIDRGGVFAQLLGTQLLLGEAERRYLKGLIINKFRGDETLLTPGVRMLEARSRCPVLGVIPYLDLELDDEDSLSDRLQKGKQERERSRGQLDVAILKFPRISNFTDFDPLFCVSDLYVRYVKRQDQLGTPDLILLPGSKSTMQDLTWLKETGLEEAVCSAARRGSFVFGICGGFQMLGEVLSDPRKVETGGSMRGLGLLPLRTVFSHQKTRTRVEGTVDGLFSTPVPLEGYEIHMGQSRRTAGVSRLCRLRDRISGEEKEDGAVGALASGTYVHGFFDRGEIVNAMAAFLWQRRGVPRPKGAAVPDGTRRAYKEVQYDRLSEGLRRHLDMERIYCILEEGM